MKNNQAYQLRWNKQDNYDIVISLGDTSSFGFWKIYDKSSFILSHPKYVHELQNLCFYLTGEELIIKE